MKKIVFSFILSLSFSCIGFAQNGYKITGKIADVSTGTIKMEILDSDGTISTDSTIIKDSTFSFAGTVESPRLALLTINNKKGDLPFFIENSDITIQTRGKGSFRRIKVSGSKTDDECNNLLKTCSNLPASESEGSCFKNLVLNNSTSIFAPYFIQSKLIYSLDYDGLKELLDPMSGDAINTYHYKKLGERLSALEKVAVGKPAPYFEQPDVNGKLKSFKDVLSGKKYVLIDFWASWCGPCRRENPHIVKAYNEYHKKGFDIFAVSLDDDKEKWKNAIKADGLTWTHVSDLKFWANEAARLYCINSIPANVLIDKDGIIIARNLKGEELANKLKELLDK